MVTMLTKSLGNLAQLRKGLFYFMAGEVPLHVCSALLFLNSDCIEQHDRVHMLKESGLIHGRQETERKNWVGGVTDDMIYLQIFHYVQLLCYLWSLTMNESIHEIRAHMIHSPPLDTHLCRLLNSGSTFQPTNLGGYARPKRQK